MWTAITFIGAIGLLSIIAWAIWKKCHIKPRAMKAFARRVIDPDFRQAFEEDMERGSRAVDDAHDAPAPNASEIPALIKDLLSPDQFRNKVAMIRLEKAGANIEEDLLSAFNDPRCVWEREGSHASDSSPAERVARLLLYMHSRQLGDRLGHLVDHKEWYVSGVVIKSRAALGREDLLPFVIKQLSNQCISAEQGVELGIEQGWVEPAFMAGLLSWAKQTTLDPSLPHSAWAVRFYAKYGGEEAIKMLQTEQILSLDNNRTIHFALEELNRYQIAIPMGILTPLLEKSLASVGNWPWEYVFKPALFAMAASDPDGARRLADAQLERPDGPYSDAAVDFNRTTIGLPEPYETEPPPGTTISDDERKVLDDLQACVAVFAQVGNGGLSQYFFNPSGDSWPLVLRP